MFLVLLIVGLIVSSEAFEESSDDLQVRYLERYGYLEPEFELVGTRSGQKIERAILNFQKLAGLKLTGVLDTKTKDMMESPRCGVKDVIANYVIEGSKWEKQELTFAILNYPTNTKLSRQDVDKAIVKAFSMWQKASNLVFTRINSAPADIEISFSKDEHGDGEPFYGEGPILAHAFFPKDGGDMHVDDSENWTVDEFNGKDLMQTVVHELGHSLGLEHSDVSSSVMAPFYRGWDPFLQPTQLTFLGENFLNNNNILHSLIQ